MLEKNLSEHIGINVRLQGEFDLMLLPDIGVSGTGLVIGGPDTGELVASSAEYEISVALKPLLDGQVRIDWIRLTGGEVYPDRYSAPIKNGSGNDGAAVQIPEIQELAIRDFSVNLPGWNSGPVRVEALEVSGFADRQNAPFRLEIENLVTASGWLRWDSLQSRLDLGALRLERLGQHINGRGCVFTGDAPSVNLFLDAGRIDLDALRQDLPLSGQGTGSSGAGPSLDFRVRFSVEELVSSGAVARGVVLSLGAELPQQMVCGSD